MALTVWVPDGTKDCSPYAHAITNSTGPAAILGRGVEIPAANENAYIQIGGVGNTNTRGNLGYTVFQWIRLGRVGVDQYMLNIWSGTAAWRTLITASNRLSMSNFDGAAISTLTGTVTTFSTLRWYNVVCVYDGGIVGDNGHLYVNGVLERSGNLSTIPQLSAATGMRFGVDYPRTAANDLVGSGRDLRFYNSESKSADWVKLEYLRTRKEF